MNEFRTNDMALVTYLKQCSQHARTVGWAQETQSAFWVFDESPELLDLVQDFHLGKALVEPREYNRIFALTKREMYGQSDPHRARNR